MKASVRSTSRVLWLLAACCGAAIAWTALGLVTDSTSAQANERRAGLIDELTSIVDSTTSSVAATTGQLVNGLVDEVVVPLVQTVAPVIPAVTAPVAETVTQIADPIVDVVATVPVVGQPAAAAVSEVVNTATSTVGTVVDAGTELLGSHPVGSITDPLRSTLGQVPIVGKLVNAIDPLLTRAVTGSDTVLATVGNTVHDALNPVINATVTPPGTHPEAPLPVLPGIIPNPETPAVPAPVFGAAFAADQGALTSTLAQLVTSRSAVFSEQIGTHSNPRLEASQGSGVPGSGTDGKTATHLPSSSPTSSASSGGGSAGTLATISDSDPQLHSAVAAASGAGDDELPAAPVFDTDISPD